MTTGEIKATVKFDGKIAEGLLKINAEYMVSILSKEEAKQAISDLFDSTEISFKDGALEWRMKE